MGEDAAGEDAAGEGAVGEGAAGEGAAGEGTAGEGGAGRTVKGTVAVLLVMFGSLTTSRGARASFTKTPSALGMTLISIMTDSPTGMTPRIHWTN